MVKNTVGSNYIMQLFKIIALACGMRWFKFKFKSVIYVSLLLDGFAYRVWFLSHLQNEKSGLLQLSVFELIKWTAELLRWNPSDYGGIKQFNVPVDHLWTPDIGLLNAQALTLYNRTSRTQIEDLVN